MRKYQKSKRKQFFFEKKNQKTFAPLRAYVATATGRLWT